MIAQSAKCLPGEHGTCVLFLAPILKTGLVILMLKRPETGGSLGLGGQLASQQQAQSLIRDLTSEYKETDLWTQRVTQKYTQ